VPVPFLRLDRDKRGFEYLAILHQDSRRGQSRPSLVYYLRVPPGLRIGRRPLDEDTRRRLETAHPDIIFDWAKLKYAPARGGETSGA
jgi:hypothetical protein